MSLRHHLHMWFQQKIWKKPEGVHEEETVALPEVHTGKVHHTAAEETPAKEKPIHYDNVAIPEVHIHHKHK